MFEPTLMMLVELHVTTKNASKKFTTIPNLLISFFSGYDHLEDFQHTYAALKEKYDV